MAQFFFKAEKYFSYIWGLYSTSCLCICWRLSHSTVYIEDYLINLCIECLLGVCLSLSSPQTSTLQDTPELLGFLRNSSRPTRRRRSVATTPSYSSKTLVHTRVHLCKRIIKFLIRLLYDAGFICHKMRMDIFFCHPEWWRSVKAVTRSPLKSSNVGLQKHRRYIFKRRRGLCVRCVAVWENLWPKFSFSVKPFFLHFEPLPRFIDTAVFWNDSLSHSLLWSKWSQYFITW